MRSAAVWLVLALCRWFKINPIAEARLSAPADVVERGARWELFYREEGGLADMIAVVRRSYFEQASAIGHRDNDKLYEFAVADRLARELEREVQQIIATGTIAKAKREETERLSQFKVLKSI